MTDSEPNNEARVTADGADERDAVSSTDDRAAIGWPRAILTGLAVIVVGFAGAILGPNAILTKSLALTRTAREWLATALFLAVVAILAVALRWLQHRRLI